MDVLVNEMSHPAFWLAVVQVIWINILLSGDNAVVIALACRGLPPKERRWGMVIGAGVASVLLIVFTGVVSMLMTLPYLKMLSAVALIWIAVNLLAPASHDEEDTQEAVDDLWRAVRLVVVANIVMSLDNVIAVAAVAKGNYVLLTLGLVVSIPIVIAGSAIILALLERFPILVWGGAGVLGWVAGEIFATDSVVLSFFSHFEPEQVELVSQVVGAVIVLGAGMVWRSSHKPLANQT